MEDKSTEYLLGQIDGKLTGIGLEIKGIREAMKCQSDDCKACRGELDSKVEKIEVRVTGLEEFKAGHSGERTATAVISDRAVGYSGVLIAAIAVGIALWHG